MGVRPRLAADVRGLTPCVDLTDASTISSFATPRPIYDVELTDRYVFTIVSYGKATQVQVHDPATAPSPGPKLETCPAPRTSPLVCNGSH